jgi:hypothetical protein
MSQTILVQAVVGEGYDGAYRAGRKWPATEPLAVEVLDQDDDPPGLEEDWIVDGVRKGKRTVPDPNRIGKRSFEAIKADGRLRILGDKDTSLSQSDAALNKARHLAASHAAENSDLKIKIAALQEENEKLRAQVGASQAPAVTGGEQVPPGLTEEEDATIEGATLEESGSRRKRHR